MILKTWGSRGSFPAPGKDTIIYGGNTSCSSVEVDNKIFIFDAGTGIINCGKYLLSKPQPLEAYIFISHTHWDHIQGFPFFIPSFIPGNKFYIYGPPSDVNKFSLEKVMELQTSYEYFPIRVSQLGAKIEYFDCSEGIISLTDNLHIQVCKVNHPVNCFAYKLTFNDKTLIYGGDHEPYMNIYRNDKNSVDELDEEFMKELDNNSDEQNKKISSFCRDADIIIWDAQYTTEEYATKIGWGHSTYEATIDLAKNSRVKHLIIHHHDPVSTDKVLKEREEKFKQEYESDNFKITFEKEGMEIKI
jgi:phosphoribosyl 1,2-cyclic phosphodiesterase